MKFEPQVPKEHYFQGYDTKERFISYWYQIDAVLKTKPKKVLEIGIGNKTVTNYLRTQGIEVTTVDIDENLDPDYVCSVTELSNCFEGKIFDTILCAEVLEHLPFEYFEISLKEMQKVTRNYVIISLPNFGTARFSFKIPRIKEKNILIKLPYSKEHKFDGEHYWEIGKKGYPLSKILAIISQFFEIENNYLLPENPYHRFFVLRAKNK